MEFFHWFNSCLLQCYVSLSDRPARRVGLSSIQSGLAQTGFLGGRGPSWGVSEGDYLLLEASARARASLC